MADGGATNGGGVARKQGAIRNGTLGRFVATYGLTEQQAEFVRQLVRNGGNGTAAAEAAGYSSPRTGAYQLLALPHVRAAIREERSRAIEGELASEALGTLKAIMRDQEAPAHVRRLAARDILEMAGHIGPAAKPEKPNENKPLAEMTQDELQRFIEAEEKALAELKRAVPETIEGTAEAIAPGIAPGVTVIEAGELDELPGSGRESTP